MKIKILLSSLALLALSSALTVADPLGTAFTYQGKLSSGGNAANGVYNFTFALFDAASGGAQQGPTVITNGVGVSTGLFSVTLDFGNQFTGSARWLEIAVCTNGSEVFTLLAPRQPLTPVPYTLYAPSAGNAQTVVNGVYTTGSYSNPNWLTSLGATKLIGTLPDGNLSGNVALLNANQAFTSTVTFSPPFGPPFVIPPQFTNVIVTNLNAGNADTVDGMHASAFWQLPGNNAPAGSFLGTLNNLPLELRANNTRALLLDPGVNAPNVIGGFNGNAAIGGVSGATIAGGGSAGNLNVAASDFAAIGGGVANTIAPQSSYSTICGGVNNNVQYGDLNSVIAGGVNNLIQSNNWYSVIGGGGQNTISNNAWYSLVNGGGGNAIGAYTWWSAIGGGVGNTILTNCTYSVIAGGDMNAILSSAQQATISGGTSNLVQNNANGATIGGGYGNTAQAGAAMATIAGGNANRIEGGSMDSTIGGGFSNVVRSNKLGATIGGGGLNVINANYSAIPGGANNVVAGDYGFAAGQNAQALNQGAFVWADSTPGVFASTANDQFLIRAAGGVGIGTVSPTAALHVASAGSSDNPQALFAQQNSTDAVRLRLAVTGATGWDVAAEPAATGSLGFWTVGGNRNMEITRGGQVNATSFSGNGSALTGIVRNSIASGAVVKTLNGLADDVLLAAGSNVTLSTNGNTLTIAATGGGGGGWSLTGNAGTAPPGNFLGTTDNNSLELWVNNSRAFRLEPTTNSPNIIGGFGYNSVSAGSYGVTIAGGGQTFYTNLVNSSSSLSAIGGGGGHKIDLNSSTCTIAGGGINTIKSNTYAATIAGGYQNTVNTNAQYAAIGGGDHNAANAEGNTIAGGEYNTAANLYSTVGGGTTDAATNYCATVAGGYVNTAGGQCSAVGGGQLNLATGDYSVIPGGFQNVASGTNSLAAGNQAQALHAGSFVWADTQAPVFPSTAANQVSFRCLGGVRFTSGSGTTNQMVSWTPGTGAWSFSSDRNLKEDLVPVDPESVLDKVAQLPLSEWNYIGYPQRHIGPMAQDFHVLFPLNESDTTLNEADLHGVTLAAIQGLNHKLEEQLRAKDARIQSLEERLSALEARLNTQAAK